MSQLFLNKYGGDYTRISPTKPTRYMPWSPREVALLVGSGYYQQEFVCKTQLLMENSRVLKAILTNDDDSHDENQYESCSERSVSTSKTSQSSTDDQRSESTSETSESSTEDAIPIPDIRPEVFREILGLMKFKELTVKIPFVKRPTELLPVIYRSKEIVLAAIHYEMPKVLNLCIKAILNDRDNFIKRGVTLYEAIKELKDPEVVKKQIILEDHLIRWFEYISKTSSFDEFSLESLHFFMEHKHFYVSNEADLFLNCVRWAEVQCTKEGLSQTRKNLRAALGDLIQKIRFPLMTRKEFTKEIEPLGILKPDHCRKMQEYFKLWATDRNDARNLDLPFQKVPRTGQLFVANIFRPSESKRQWHSFPEDWEVVQFKASRPIEIDTIVLSGELDESQKQDDLLITFKWNSLQGSSKTVEIIQHLKAKNPHNGVIYIKLKTPLMMKAGKWHRLQFQFTNGGILSNGSKSEYMSLANANVSVYCKQRGKVKIDATKHPVSCCFRGFKFRLLSKLIPNY